MLDVMPFAALSIAGSRLFEQSVRRLVRWESGPGVFKIDWALDGPVPWADETSGRAGTVHVGGSFDEVAAAEAASYEDERFNPQTQTQVIWDAAAIEAVEESRKGG